MEGLYKGQSIGQALNTVDVSADQRVAAFGGNNHLVLARLSSDLGYVEVEESHSVRGVVLGDQRLSLKPLLKVKFNPTFSLAHLLATCSSGGALAVWNIMQAKGAGGQWKPEYVLKEHSQAVSSICWHFSNPQTLLTGSNDAKIKLWDLRVKTRSTLTISPKSSYVRDVAFRKVEGSHRFAAAFGNGTVQVWDVRHPKVAEVGFTAHDIAYTVDWNPEVNNLLASGGRDGLIKVWDAFQQNQQDAEAQDKALGTLDTNSGAAQTTTELSATGSLTTSAGTRESGGDAKPVGSAARRSKRKRHFHAEQTIETVDKGVARVQWRPDHPYQIASMPLRGSKIHLWNTLEPTVPLAVINACHENDSLNGFIWLDQFLSKEEVIGSSLYGTSWWGDDDDEVEDEEDEDNRSQDMFSTGAGSQAKSEDTDGIAKLRVSIMQSHKKNNLSVKVPGQSQSLTGTTTPDGAQSVAGSTASRETSNLATGDAGAESFARRREQQRLRFRQFRHRHKNEEECQQSWGNLFSCSLSGQVFLRGMQDSYRPLEEHLANSLSISCHSRLAAVYDPIPNMRTKGAFLLNKVISPSQAAPRPSTRVRIFGPRNFSVNWNEPNAKLSQPQQQAVHQHHDTFASVLLGFDAEQFKVLAKSYVTPKTLSEGSSSYKPRDPFAEPEIPMQQPRVRTPQEIATCCTRNACVADEAKALGVAQVWRLLKLLYAPETAENQLDESLLTVNVKDEVALQVALERVAKEGVNKSKRKGMSNKDKKGPRKGSRLPDPPGKMRKAKRASVLSHSDAFAGDMRGYGESDASVVEVSISSVASVNGGDRSSSPTHRKLLSVPGSPATSPPRSPSSSVSSSAPRRITTSSTGPGSAGSRTPKHRGRRHMRASSASNLHAQALKTRRSVDSFGAGKRSKERSFDSLEHSGSDSDEFDGQVVDSFHDNEGDDGPGLDFDLGSSVAVNNTNSGGSSAGSLLLANSLAQNKDRRLSVDSHAESDGSDRLKVGGDGNGGDEGGKGESHDIVQSISREMKDRDDGHTVERSSVVLVGGKKGTSSDASALGANRHAKKLSVSDPFPMEQGVNGLWLGSSLNLLCRLNTVYPMDDSKFKVNTSRLDQDRRELMEALSLAKPLPTLAPVPMGHQRLRKQQRMLRRQQFSYYYNLMYSKQRTAYLESTDSARSAGGVGGVMQQVGVANEEERDEVSSRSEEKDIHVHEGKQSMDKAALNEGKASLDGAEAFSLSGVSPLTASPFALVTGNNDALRSKLVHKLLEHHAEIGDVQTCAMVVLVLGEMLQPAVEKRRVRMWVCSYIDLLQQLQVFSIAARIISACEDQEVERWYQMTSMVAEGCSNCAQSNKKNIIRANPNFRGKCSTCEQNVSRCSICEQLVRGMYVWCQGCGHGGHLDHLSQWFRTESTCPTGCGHHCGTLSETT